MKKSIIILFSLILISCSVSPPSYIHGYIYDEKHTPVKALKIENSSNSNIYSFTDEKGYFRIDRMISSDFLYVKIKDVTIDSIYYFRVHPERGGLYYFVEGRSDTLFIDMSKYEK